MSSLPGSSEQNFIESSLLQIMTLLATLSAAREVKFRFEERKAGRDPSHQEDESFVRAYLLEAEDELRVIVLDLRASFLLYEDERHDVISYSVRRFNDLSQFHHLSGLLQHIHQRLLSLYPNVTEELVEEARLLSITSNHLISEEGTHFLEAASRFLDRSLAFCDSLLREF